MPSFRLISDHCKPDWYRNWVYQLGNRFSFYLHYLLSPFRHKSGRVRIKAFFFGVIIAFHSASCQIQLIELSQLLWLISPEFPLALGNMFFLFPNFDVFSASFTKFSPRATPFFVSNNIAKRKHILTVLALSWSLITRASMFLKLSRDKKHIAEGARLLCMKLILDEWRST